MKSWREDHLFPRFEKALGEDFESLEHKLFGKEGFEGVVERVGGIEKRIGIYELSQFTPKS